MRTILALKAGELGENTYALLLTALTGTIRVGMKGLYATTSYQ
jgi:hypothetical protein